MHLMRPQAVLVPVCVMTASALLPEQEHRLATGMSVGNYTSALEMVQDMDADGAVAPVLGVDTPPAFGAALGAAADLPPAPQLQEVGARLFAIPPALSLPVSVLLY